MYPLLCNICILNSKKYFSNLMISESIVNLKHLIFAFDYTTWCQRFEIYLKNIQS